MKNISSLALAGLFLFASATTALAQPYLHVYKGGNLRYRHNASAVQNVSVKGGSVVNFLDSNNSSVYSVLRSGVDQISMDAPTPVADMLDVVFLDDGTAIDISPRHMNVEKKGSTQSIFFSNTYQRNVAKFVNPWAGNASGYYKVNYENDQDFKNRLANGHTLECLFSPSISGSLADVECKPFSSHQGGGTGFLISRKANGNYGSAGGNVITFLPNTTSGGWRWATSGVTPQNGTYYHVVGVYDKSAGKARVYINGQLKGTVDAAGDFKFASAGSVWFGIGCDADASNGGQAWAGNIVLARVYDKVLSQSEITALWNKVSVPVVPDLITNFNLVSASLPIPSSNGKFLITGDGFREGDQVVIRSIDGTHTATVPLKKTPYGWIFAVPAGFPSGNYKVVIQRGNVSQELGTANFNIVNYQLQRGTRVIAHRGDHSSGAPENSCASLREAVANHFYGSETDAYITNDGQVIINHDASRGGVTIEKSSFNTCRGVKLSNGEPMPDLREFLQILKDNPQSPTKLILEIKHHSSSARGYACIDRSVQLVKEYGLQDKVEYIAFDYDYCKRVLQDDPNARVAYLSNGAEKDANTLFNDCITGCDYEQGKFPNQANVESFKKKGLTTNVWTVNDYNAMVKFADWGMDFITTNEPKTAQRLYLHYAANHDELMLDIQFNADGTITDGSTYRHTVRKSGNVPVQYNSTLGAYEGKFINNWGGADAANFCRVDYDNDQTFQFGLLNGHTLETIFCVDDYSGHNAGAESKWFSSHQAGGTGFLLTRNENGHDNVLTFLPNTRCYNNNNNYRWAMSNVKPAQGTYYHVVGVWDRDQSKAHIYVRNLSTGEVKKGTTDAAGMLNFPANKWIGIGADPKGDAAELSGKWRIVRVRIYDRAFTSAQVSELWGK